MGIGHHHPPTLAFDPQEVFVPSEVGQRVEAFAAHSPRRTKSERVCKAAIGEGVRQEGYPQIHPASKPQQKTMSCLTIKLKEAASVLGLLCHPFFGTGLSFFDMAVSQHWRNLIEIIY